MLDDVHRVFAVDALASSHPLSSPEDSIVLPHQITEQFDAVSYSKVPERLTAGQTSDVPAGGLSIVQFQTP